MRTPEIGDTVKDTEKTRQFLAKAKVVVIDGDELYFVMPDGTQIEVYSFERCVLLAHALGVEVDWEATF